jgi:DNA-binding transcriptional MerR regulator
MAETLYTASFIANHISKIFGLTVDAGLLRTIRYWASTGLLRPSGTVFTGKGKNRLFPLQEIVRAVILLELSNWGIPVGLLQGAMTKLSKSCANLVGTDNLVHLLNHTPKGFIIFTIVLRRDGEREVQAAVSSSPKSFHLGNANVLIALAPLQKYLL